jgi:glycosyltransferase involved in cell wall biosynthesis
MKIAFFTHYTELYGANRSLIGLIEGLQGLDAKIEFLVVMPAAGSELEAILLKKKVQTRIVPFMMCMQYRWYSRFLLKRPWQYAQYLLSALLDSKKNRKAVQVLSSELQKWQPDLLYSNTSVLDVGYEVARRLNRPHVRHLREFGWQDYKLIFPFSDGKKHYQKIAQSALRIAISKQIADYFQVQTKNIDIQILYNGILKKEQFKSLRLQAEKAAAESTHRPFTFCIIGLIQATKGQIQAIQALSIVLKKYPQTQLWVVGKGDTKPLEDLITRQNLSTNVRLKGAVRDVFTEVFPYIDATLMCSQAEAMGRVTVESMAAMRPVIGRNTAGTAELIAQGRGLAYDGTTEDLAQKMIFLIENPADINKMTAKAWDWVYENFSIEDYAEKIYNLLKRFCS